jgi:hypothetical protein
MSTLTALEEAAKAGLATVELRTRIKETSAAPGAVRYRALAIGLLLTARRDNVIGCSFRGSFLRRPYSHLVCPSQRISLEFELARRGEMTACSQGVIEPVGKMSLYG